MMKTTLLLTFLSALAVHAQTYTSKWSEFDSGRAAHQGGAVTHAGVFSGWLREPMQSTHYGNQQGYPALPMPAPVPVIPVLTISLVGDDVRVAWPASATGFVLEETILLGNGLSWTGVPGPYQENSGERFILVPDAQGIRFYRLMSP